MHLWKRSHQHHGSMIKKHAIISCRYSNLCERITTKASYFIVVICSCIGCIEGLGSSLPGRLMQLTKYTIHNHSPFSLSATRVTTPWLKMQPIALLKTIGYFNHRLVTLVANKLWLWVSFGVRLIKQSNQRLPCLVHLTQQYTENPQNVCKGVSTNCTSKLQ